MYALWDEVSDEDGGAEQSGEEEVEEVVWCEACSKGYRSGGAWEDHERSRKHVKNVQRYVELRPSFVSCPGSESALD